MKWSKAEVAEAREFLAKFLYPAEGEEENGVDVRQCPASTIDSDGDYCPCVDADCHWCSGTGEYRREWSRRRVDKKGATVYQSVTHVARSGMSRSITNMVIVENEPVKIDWAVARVLGESCDGKNGGVKVGGCGMDMGFHIVNYLSYALHGHHNTHPLAGYTLEHRWL